MNDRGGKPEKSSGGLPAFDVVTYAEWLRAVEAQLEEPRRQIEGIDIEPLCTATHPSRSTELGAPPRRAAWTPARPWIVCQSYSTSDREKLNHHLKDDLRHGVLGARLGVHTPTGLTRMRDFQVAFDGVEEAWPTLILDSGAQFLASSAVALGWLDKASGPREGQHLFLGADPLGELAARGSLPASMTTMGEDLATLVRQSHESLPGTRALAVSTEAFREAGADVALELAIALASATHYLRELEPHGLEPEQVVPEIAFFTATGQQTFVEIAKLRALRALWSRIQRACRIEGSLPPWIHARVLDRNLPPMTPDTNILRVTNAAMAAIVGGADSVETPTVGGSTSTANSNHRLSRNIQHVLGLEAHLGKVMDPAAGSYQIETMTQRLQQAGWELFREIESRGGAFEVLKSGWMQQRVSECWETRRRRVAEGSLSVLGVTVHSDAAAKGDEPLTRSDPTRTGSAAPAAEVSSEGLPGGAADRWTWCQQQARRDVSAVEMERLLYGQGDRVTVPPLVRHQDSELQEVAGE